MPVQQVQQRVETSGPSSMPDRVTCAVRRRRVALGSRAHVGAACGQPVEDVDEAGRVGGRVGALRGAERARAPRAALLALVQAPAGDARHQPRQAHPRQPNLQKPHTGSLVLGSSSLCRA